MKISNPDIDFNEFLQSQIIDAYISSKPASAAKFFDKKLPTKLSQIFEKDPLGVMKAQEAYVTKLREGKLDIPIDARDTKAISDFLEHIVDLEEHLGGNFAYFSKSDVRGSSYGELVESYKTMSKKINEEYKSTLEEIEKGIDVPDNNLKLNALRDLTEKMLPAQRAYLKNEAVTSVNEMSKRMGESSFIMNATKLMKELESVQTETKGIYASIEKHKDLETLYKKMKMLHDAGIVANEENLRLYEKILDVVVETNRELEKAKAKKTLMNDIQDQQLSLAMSQATAAGNAKQQAHLEKINALKKSGLELTKENYTAMERELKLESIMQERMRKFNLSSSLLGQAKNLTADVMRASGNVLGASIYQARNQAREMKGSPLSLDELRRVDELTKLQQSLLSISAVSVRDDVIKTNELASRGGFTKSVVYDKNGSEKAALKIQTDIRKILEQSLKVQQDNYRALF